MDWIKTNPDKTVLLDTGAEKAMSYGELDRLTSSIYAYLTDTGIGREDFVMIDLPRGINVAVAAIGVWRAGAAYVIVDEGTPDSIKDYMYQDCGCRLAERKSKAGRERKAACCMEAETSIAILYQTIAGNASVFCEKTKTFRKFQKRLYKPRALCYNI